MKKLLILFSISLILFQTSGCSSPATTVSPKALGLFQKGKAAYLKRDLKSAKIFFENALKEETGFVNAQVMLGKTLFFMGKVKQAGEHLGKAIKAAIFHVEALYYMARIALLAKKPANAAAYLEKILEVDPVNARANFALGSIHADKKNYKKAFFHYNAALAEESMLARVRYSYAARLAAAGLKNRAKAILKPALGYSAHTSLKKSINTLWRKLK